MLKSYLQGDGEAFGRWLGLVGGIPRNKVSALISIDQESSLAPSAMWEYNKKTMALNEEACVHQTLNLPAHDLELLRLPNCGN